MRQREFNDVDGVVEIPGARALLESLPGERWAIVTSAERPLALRRIKAAGLSVPQVLITADEIGRGKPSPDGFLAAARQLQAAPESAVVFEDSEAGISAGLAACATVIALTTTLPVERIEAMNPLGHVHDLQGFSASTDGKRLILRLMRNL
nr:HAD-IA family hydrolase [Paraburkholderia fungorum]